MGELTSCNFCSLQSIKARAKREGKKVLMACDPLGDWRGGQRVYVYPKEVQFSQLSVKAKERYFCSWFAELPEKCCC